MYLQNGLLVKTRDKRLLPLTFIYTLHSFFKPGLLFSGYRNKNFNVTLSLLSSVKNHIMALIFKYLTSSYHNKWFQTFLAFPEIERKVKMLVSFEGNKAFLIITNIIDTMW